MQTSSILQLSDWGIKKVIIAVLSIQLAVWGAVGLDALGINIPILRQVIVFIYLSFIPGYLILRILKIHQLSAIETLLYAVGLSLSFTMLSGVLINSVCPIFGFNKPISSLPLIISISIEIIILCIICYLRDNDVQQLPPNMCAENIFSLPVLLLTLLPIIAICGTYLINFYGHNLLLMLLIAVLALLAVLTGFGVVPEKLYPYAIFVTAISLLFHTSLFSSYIWGWDIQHEYYLANLVIKNSFWDYLIPFNTNGMLSIVMLAPIYSKLCAAELVWVFKIIYPLFFSLVPLGLYHAYQKQTNNKIAFFSCFLLISLFTFYTEMVGLARQQIAELFLVLIILVILSEKISKINKSILFIIFAFSLFVSHYGLSYIFLFCLTGALLILKIFDSNKHEPDVANKQHRVININNVGICLAFAITWYICVSDSSTFNTVVFIGNDIISNLAELFNPESVQGMAMIKAQTSSLLHETAKAIHLLTHFFIAIGIFALITKKVRLNEEYAAFSLMKFFLLIACLILPYFASALNTTRFYQISLIFLAPFCIIGVYTAFQYVSNLFQIKYNIKTITTTLSVFLAIFLLFNTGFVYEIAKDNPTSFFLNTELDGPYFNQQEVRGAEWLFQNRNKKLVVYADGYRSQLCKSIANYEKITTDKNLLHDFSRTYIYLGTFNLKEKLLYVVEEDKGRKEHIDIETKIIIDRSKIYDSENVNILR
jgi:uncharacterized membrane protein